MIRTLCQLLALTSVIASSSRPLLAAELNVLQKTVVDPSALNFAESAASFSQNINGRTYQRHPMSTLKGYQYTAYYDSSRNVCLARRKLPAGNWEIIRFTGYTINGNDSHNVVTLGICHLDGTIHLAFDHHGGPLHYRVSDLGVASNPESVVWSDKLFGTVTNSLGSAGSVSSITYPTFFNSPNGNLMLYYRFQGSGSGDGMIHEYDGTTNDWTTGMGKFIARTGSYTGAISNNSTSRNPYINGISYAGNRLHASWGWRESAGGSSNNHDLNYAYSDDDGRTWKNSAGSHIGTTNSSSISINSTGLIVASIPQNIGLSNQYTHYAYPDGSCHVMVVHNEPGTSNRSYQHYWRDASGTWSNEALGFSGTRPKLVGDDDRNLFLAYTSAGKPRIAKGTPNASNTAWTWSLIHTQSDTTEGGEGQVDYTRWEAERILSFYGQEASNANGDPTPLHIFDYQVSAKAILPQPLDEQPGVAETSSLQWTGGIGATAHRIYLGTDATAVATATTASPEYMGQQSGSQFLPSAPLDSQTAYFWRIDEVDGNSDVHQGLLWSFTTAGNFPPTISPIPDQAYSFGSPIPDIPFIIGDDNLAADSLLPSVSSSNSSLVPQSGLTITGTGSNRILQVTPAPSESGVSTITITVDDGTHQTEESFTLTIDGPVYQLFSDTGDASIRENPDVVDIDKVATLLGTGGSSPRVDRCTVYVFQLPDMGAIASPFTSASFSFEFAAKQGDLHSNDLYGIARRATSEVLASDYYGKTATVDPGASLLETGILTNTSSSGVISNSSPGENALREFLNAEYESGAGAGQFVFIRLNTAGYRDGIDRATLTMSEGASTTPVDTRPRISITTEAFTELHKWRAKHFGTPINSGAGADDADANSDGESNFFEFVTGQDPYASALATTGLAPHGSDLEFTYHRNADAVSDGNIFTVEWSDTLLPESWSDIGVSESVDSEAGSIQTIIATLPSGSAGRRFVRLKVASP